LKLQTQPAPETSGFFDKIPEDKIVSVNYICAVFAPLFIWRFGDAGLSYNPHGQFQHFICVCKTASHI